MSKLNSLTEDFLSEIIPADITTLIGCVIVTVFVSENHVDHQAGKVIGVGWSTDLVVDNL